MGGVDRRVHEAREHAREHGSAHHDADGDGYEEHDEDCNGTEHGLIVSRYASLMTKPVGPYTPLVRAGDTLYVSGQLGLLDGALVDGLDAQVRQAVTNLAGLLEAEGALLDNIVKTTVLLASIDDYAAMNTAYTESFGDHRPARAAFAVAALPLGGLVEIEAIAVI